MYFLERFYELKGSSLEMYDFMNKQNELILEENLFSQDSFLNYYYNYLMYLELNNHINHLNEKIEFLENHYFEDNAIMPFLCAVAGKFSYIEKPFYYYLQRNGSILNKTYYDKKWEDIFDSLKHLYQKFDEYQLLDKYHYELEYIYIEYLLHAPSLRFMLYKEGISNIKKIDKIMHDKFPKWRKNKYYKLENIKYKTKKHIFRS